MNMVVSQSNIRYLQNIGLTLIIQLLKPLGSRSWLHLLWLRLSSSCIKTEEDVYGILRLKERHIQNGKHKTESYQF